MARATIPFLITKIIDHTPSVRELQLKCEAEKPFTFKAGQFVMLHVPTDEAKPALRAYSIASTDKDSTGFTLLFKYVEGGKASQFVWKLQEKETLQFTGPFGKVFFKTPPTEQVVFLNTGTGLSQHLSFLLSNKDEFRNVHYKLLFGVRNENEIYYRDVLESLKKELPSFEYDYVLSRPSESWTGKRGYVQNFLNDFKVTERPTTIYICGNGGMIKDVKAILESQGFDKSNIHAEAFD